MLKPHKPNLHSKQHSQHIHAIIGHIQPHRIPPGNKQRQHIKRYQIDNKNITSPGRNHIKIPKSRRQSPRQRPRR
uniref:Uncharacterized protein n=1 Tax=Salix viminalis TaxID=40686 RepID=A0A6N2KA46_SALVM